MTREQQRQRRELKKALPKMLKPHIKNYGFKTRDGFVWVRKDELFFCWLPFLLERGGRCICTSMERVKPMWIDDLFWDIFGMSENKNAPMGLRANGAFTVFGAEIYTHETVLETWEPEEVEQCMLRYLEHFRNSVQASDIETFYNGIGPSTYHEELQNTLVLIHEEKYEEALAYLGDAERGGFCNQGLWINDAMREYCKNRLTD